jgi:PAS domain S-box-containing protein
MTDQEKTREQLLEEVRTLRQRVARLEGRDRERRPANGTPGASRALPGLAPAGATAADARRQAEERFATIFHASPVAISLTTLAEGRFVDVNDSFLRLFGYCREEVIGRTTAELGLWPDPADRALLMGKLRERRSIRDQEGPFRVRFGEERYGLLSMELVDVGGTPQVLAMVLDITERRRAERARHESEELLRQLAENLREVFWIAAPHDSRVLYVSPGYEEVWGRSCASLYEQPLAWLDAVHPEDRGRVEAAFGQAGETGTCRVEYRVVRPDGSVRWVYDRVSPIGDADGRVYRLVGVAEDVTERKEADERLRASEEQHRLICELTSDYAYTCRVDADGTVTMDSVSEGFQRILGYTLEESNARGGWAAFIHPDDLPAVMGRMPELLTGRRGVDELRVITRAGDTRWIRYSTQPIWDEAEGRVVRLLGAVEDVTERRRAEEELRESEERLRGFFEAAFEGLVIHDNGIILDANQRFADLFGYPLAEVIGRSVLALGAPESRDDVRRHIRDGDEGPYEAVGLRQDGSTFPGELRGKPIIYRGRPARVTAVRDISRRKQAQEKLQEYAGRLQALSQRLLEVQESERRALARELHDEIGQLLTGLKLSLERSSRLAGGGLRTALEEAEGQVRDLTGRVRDLSLRLRPTMLDDLGLLPALMWQFERYTAQTRVAVSFEHGPLPGRFPPAVETAAYRIIQEALTNAARHAGVAGVVVRLWADREGLGLQVEDRGAGFDPHGVAAAGTSGGLSGMQERVRLLGGRLDVDSAPGAGTRVTAELPLGDAGRRGATGPDGRPSDPGGIP